MPFLAWEARVRESSSWVSFHFLPWLLGLDKTTNLISSSCKTLPGDPIIAWLQLTWAHQEKPMFIVRQAEGLTCRKGLDASDPWKQHFIQKEEVRKEKKWDPSDQDEQTHNQLSEPKLSTRRANAFHKMSCSQINFRHVTVFHLEDHVSLSFPEQPYVL